jgi:hypothetical protein
MEDAPYFKKTRIEIFLNFEQNSSLMRFLCKTKDMYPIFLLKMLNFIGDMALNDLAFKEKILEN